MSLLREREGRTVIYSTVVLSRCPKIPDRLYRTVRYDWLGQYVFDSLYEVMSFATH
jgi:hypothetical protein